jgi:hypothetical protein
MDELSRYKLALLRIKGWTAPHQSIDIHEAIGIICDIWNEAREALGDNPAAPGEASWRSPVPEQ